MAQPSVASFFNNRKRAAVEDAKIKQARKVLVLDSDEVSAKLKNGLGKDTYIVPPQDSLGPQHDFSDKSEKLQKLQEKEERTVGNKIIMARSVSIKVTPKKALRTSKSTKLKTTGSNKGINEFFNKINKQESLETHSEKAPETTVISTKVPEEEKHVTPPNTPNKRINAMDKLTKEGPSLKEIKNKMTRSARLSELKASLNRFSEGAKKLSEIEKKTSQIPESPKLKGFRTIELEVQTSPQKIFSPEKSYLSPKKDGLGVRRNLLNLLSPTKNAVALPAQTISKELLQETSKPALTLPYKYRFLAEIFRTVDTVIQIMFNRKETVTFKKLKPGVEEMLKRNLTEKHLAQIKTVYPEAYTFTQEKLKMFGSGMRAEQWELVIKPEVSNSLSMSAEFLLERRRKFFNSLLDKVKVYHQEFLMSLETPIEIPKDKVTRWHPQFDIEKVPDIELSSLPQPPAEDKLTTGKEVLDKARVLFNCNTRMESALQRLKEAKQTQTPAPVSEETKELPQSVLKGIPKALLEKVRQKQAAKAFLSMTRSVDKEKEIMLYSRLPEIARLTRNLFVSEKKGVLPLDTVIGKLGNCYRGNLSRVEMQDHLKAIAKEVPHFLVFHDVRNSVYIKLNKNSDLSLVVSKLEGLCKQKNQS